jgi:hypothetical protein
LYTGRRGAERVEIEKFSIGKIDPIKHRSLGGSAGACHERSDKFINFRLDSNLTTDEQSCSARHIDTGNSIEERVSGKFYLPHSLI